MCWKNVTATLLPVGVRPARWGPAVPPGCSRPAVGAALHARPPREGSPPGFTLTHFANSLQPTLCSEGRGRPGCRHARCWGLLLRGGGGPSSPFPSLSQQGALAAQGHNCPSPSSGGWDLRGRALERKMQGAHWQGLPSCSSLRGHPKVLHRLTPKSKGQRSVTSLPADMQPPLGWNMAAG